jgi:hypothetical protein
MEHLRRSTNSSALGVTRTRSSSIRFQFTAIHLLSPASTSTTARSCGSPMCSSTVRNCALRASAHRRRTDCDTFFVPHAAANKSNTNTPEPRNGAERSQHNDAEPCAAANRLRGHGTCGRPPPPFHPPAGAAPAPPVAELGVVRRCYALFMKLPSRTLFAAIALCMVVTTAALFFSAHFRSPMPWSPQKCVMVLLGCGLWMLPYALLAALTWFLPDRAFASALSLGLVAIFEVGHPVYYIITDSGGFGWTVGLPLLALMSLLGSYAISLLFHLVHSQFNRNA